MRWYVSKIRTTLNRRPFLPEKITPYICVSPHYAFRTEPELVDGTDWLLDSGAFQDVDHNQRLTPEQALERQLAFEKKCGFVARKIVSYDWLIDEQNIDGKKVKMRWEPEAAEVAVAETINAARYLASQRERLRPRRLVLSCQGVTIEQYLRCAKDVLDVATSEDVFGFGGFCIIGRKRGSLTADGISYIEQFLEIVRQVAPLLADKGIRDAHVFGVMVVHILREASSILRQYGVELSTDSSAVERRSVIVGGIWDVDAGRFTHYLDRSDKWIGEGDVPAGKWHPNILAHENIARAVKTLEAI